MQRIRLGTFSPSVLLETARQTGRLRDAGLVVEEIPVASSPAQFRALLERGLDVVVTGPDNAIAYRFLDANPLGIRMPVRVLNAIDRGLGLGLWGRPGLHDIRSVRSFGVDVPSSGFAFAGYALLNRAGLDRADYRIDTLGATPGRVDALTTGRCDATILGAGNELRAARSGCVQLGSVTDLGPSLGAVLACLPETGELASLLASVLVETAAAVTRGRHAALVRRAAGERLGLEPAEAEAHCDVLRSATEGLVPDGSVDRAAVATVIGLRARYAPDPQLASVPERLDELVAATAIVG